jgi:protein-S-isoprenylcysteine O-methyltransferase Ste14
VHKVQLAGVVMLILGAAILFLLAGFIWSVIVTLLLLLAVMIGIILVLGGIAAIFVGGRWMRRGPWWRDEAPAST